MAKKKLYAVLWIDDYGSLKLRRKDVDWYHANAGPISYAIQCDERFPWSFDMLLDGKTDFSRDYLGYHYHPIRYKGSKALKKVYDAFRLYAVVYAFLRMLNLKMRKQAFRLLVVAVFLCALAIIALTYVLSPWLFLAFFILYAFVAALALIWYYVERRANWEFPMEDAGWNRAFIANAKKVFGRRGYEFPKIVRHGWNLPWQGSMKFYMDLGFVADASAVTVGPDSRPHISDRELHWTISQPYYASIGKDYDVRRDEADAGDKGLLELPVMLGNITAYGFGDKEKEIISQVPDGGLVGTYIHPQDDFEPLRRWVLHLKEHYDVEFISAWQAYEIFSRKCAVGSS